MSAASVVLPPPITANHGVATSPDIVKSEVSVEIVAGTPAVDYEPFLADKKYNKTSPPELLTLTQDQESVYQLVFKYFSSEDYVNPELEEDGKLTEEEKFYLVSPLFVMPCVGVLRRTRIAFRRMSVS